MSFYRISTAFLLILSISCKKDSEKLPASPTIHPSQKEQLDAINLTGTWEIFSRSRNNISDLSVKCCEFLTLSPDSIPQDLTGVFTSTSGGDETGGIFTVDTLNDSLYFSFNNRKLAFYFQLIDSTMSLRYKDEPDVVVSENWAKR